MRNINKKQIIFKDNSLQGLIMAILLKWAIALLTVSWRFDLLKIFFCNNLLVNVLFSSVIVDFCVIYQVIQNS